MEDLQDLLKNISNGSGLIRLILGNDKNSFGAILFEKFLTKTILGKILNIFIMMIYLL